MDFVEKGETKIFSTFLRGGQIMGFEEAEYTARGSRSEIFRIETYGLPLNFSSLSTCFWS